jgi:integrase
MPRKQKNLRKDKRFCVRLDIGMKIVNGEKVRERLPFYSYVSLEDAEAKRDEYIRTHPADTAPDDRNITLGKWMERWLADYKSGVADNTRDMYKSCVAYIKKFTYKEKEEITGVPIADIKMTDIRPKHLSSLAGSMKGLSKSYIRDMRQTVSQIFDAAVENRIIAKSPTGKVNYPRGTYTGHRDLADYEKDLILKYWRVHRAGRWAMIMMYAGLRRQEMAALTWEGVDLENAQMRIISAEDLKHKKTKGTKSAKGVRTIPIFRPLLEMLKEIRPENASGLVCTAANGKQLTDSSYKQAWPSYIMTLERAYNGVEPIEFQHGWRKDRQIAKFEKENKIYRELNFTAHDLRVTFYTMCYDMGVDVMTAAEWLGDDIETAMKVYARLSKRKKTEALDKATKFFEDNDY